MQYSDLIQFLRTRSYAEVEQLHAPADFMVRGDTITVWPVSTLSPYRLHYFDQELEKVEVQDGEVWKKDDFPVLEPNELRTEHGTIRPDNYIVHPHHGVGIFERIVTRSTIDNLSKQFVALRYAGEDRLFFPMERVVELMPYIGSRNPRLTRLYSKSWQKTKERIEKDLVGIARELLKIYAERHTANRPAYPESTEWEAALASSVSFDLTEDQARAVAEIKHDFSGEYPMDRLVCGDVGFGKTEVALRAAAQVMASGKQVAFIAPTTVLVEQHFNATTQRFLNLPVQIARISRLTAGKEKEMLAGLASGQVDLLVGTHRLLGKDVQFKDLGLLILDEEQKFGVAQKEYIKNIRPSVDVLSLSATPIPRTLSMSLSGLRGLSILRSAPTGRLPVETVIKPYNDVHIGATLAAELRRGGQCYVVHNRVASLGAVEERVRGLLAKEGLAEARLAIVHGQLDEKVVADRMAKFMAGEIDVLVASSIVEHGLDSPSANTLIVLHAEWFGLSDLYQLRGRVGRRATQAFAHFMIGGIERGPLLPSEEQLQLTDTARKRLLALQEAVELGSGWSVALRDLEIRGGGNILGHEQHGSMETIGLLLYSQLLQETIGREARKLGITLFHKKEIQD